MTFNTDNVNKTRVKQTSANVFQTKVNRKANETSPFWRATSTSQTLLVKWLFTGKMYFVKNLKYSEVILVF